jgi:hypothetical protein
MQWAVRGVDRNTGSERTMYVRAGNDVAARELANQSGLLVEKISVESSDDYGMKSAAKALRIISNILLGIGLITAAVGIFVLIYTFNERAGSNDATTIAVMNGRMAGSFWAISEGAMWAIGSLCLRILTAIGLLILDISRR